MDAAWTTVGKGQVAPLILPALVRKLVANGVLSSADVRDLLVDAAAQLDVLGGEQKRQAASVIVDEDLASCCIVVTV